MIRWTMSLRTVPGQNAREHWAVRAKRVKREREATMWWAKTKLAGVESDGFLRPPYQVTLTRLRKGGGRLLDDDNLAGSLKAVRDAIAQALGVDDGDREKVRFLYREDRAEEWGVDVLVEGAGGGK